MAVEKRTVDKALLTQVTAELVLVKLVYLCDSRSNLSDKLIIRLKRFYSVHLFKANARLDVPTFEDEAIQRQLEDASHINGQVVAWSTLRSIYTFCSTLVQLISQTAVLIQVVKDRPDGMILASISVAHSLGQFVHYQTSAPMSGGMSSHTSFHSSYRLCVGSLGRHDLKR